jgi:hypothetical protein
MRCVPGSKHAAASVCPTKNLYFKSFGKRKPDHVRSNEEIAAAQRAKKQAKKAAKSANTDGLEPKS